MPQSSPDLTGANIAYQITNDLYAIFTTNQTIVFELPVYLNSLVIVTGSRTLLLGSDFTVADFDTTAMSKMQLLNTSFSAQLVRSVTITSNAITPPYQIACTYQCLYMPAANVVADTPIAPKLLPRDTDELISTNLIAGEVYSLNTFVGQNLIVPAAGAFFADSVSLYLPTNPLTHLVAGTDYILIGCDLVKTRTSNNTSGVYRAILLTRPYAGNVQVTYHAYGGEATLSDVSALWESLLNLFSYLNANTFLTPDLLGTNTVISSIITRLTLLEQTTGTGVAGGTGQFFSQQIIGATANGQSISLPAGAIIIAAQFVRTRGGSVTVSLGTTSGGSDVRSNVVLSATTPVSVMGSAFNKYAFTTAQTIYLSSTSWGTSSVDIAVWYVSTTAGYGTATQVYEQQLPAVTSNGQAVALPGGAIILALELTETSGHDVVVTLGSTIGGSDVLSAADLSPSNGSALSMLGTSLDLYGFATASQIFLSSSNWNNASVNMKVWYVL